MTEDRPARIIGSIRRPSVDVVLGSQTEPVVVRRTFFDGRQSLDRVVSAERRNPLPTFVFWDETISRNDQELITKTFCDLFTYAGIDLNSLNFYGNWHERDFLLPDGTLKPHASIQWQLQSKFEASRNQIMADSVVDQMYLDPFQLTNPHWEVIFTNRDLTFREANFVIGAAQPDLGTIISLARLGSIEDPNMRTECIRTEIFHEFGHVLNLPDVTRQRNIEYALGAHCTNNGCSMRQGMRVPLDWINLTRERMSIGGQPFCGDCTGYLINRFAK